MWVEKEVRAVYNKLDAITKRLSLDSFTRSTINQSPEDLDSNLAWEIQYKLINHLGQANIQEYEENCPGLIDDLQKYVSRIVTDKNQKMGGCHQYSTLTSSKNYDHLDLSLMLAAEIKNMKEQVEHSEADLGSLRHMCEMFDVERQDYEEKENQLLNTIRLLEYQYTSYITL